MPTGVGPPQTTPHLPRVSRMVGKRCSSAYITPNGWFRAVIERFPMVERVEKRAYVQAKADG